MLPSLGALDTLRLNEDGISTDGAAEERLAEERKKRAEAEQQSKRAEALRRARERSDQEIAEAAKAAEAAKRKKRIVFYGDEYERELNLVPGYDEMHAAFKRSKVVVLAEDYWFKQDSVDKGSKELVRRQQILSSLVKDDVFFHSCVPGWSGGKIVGARFDRYGNVGNAVPAISAWEAQEAIQAEFAWKRGGDSDDERRCGTSNCFEPNRKIQGAGVTQADRMLANCIAFFAEETPEEVPAVVNVRAPRISEIDYKKMLKTVDQEYTELFLTLRMAKHQLTPAVYLAAPVYWDDGLQHANFAFCYFTEAGWTDLGKLMSTLVRERTEAWKAERADTFAEANANLERLGKAVVACLQKTAEQTILLTDVKAGNMVAKRRGDSFDVRMIDFDSTFSVDINNYPQLPKTTEKCILFLNSLLLVNYALGYAGAPAKALVFSQVALEMVATWRAMDATGQKNRFCALLGQDEQWAEKIQKRDGKPSISFENKSRLAPTDFFYKMRAMFYSQLMHYGDPEVVQPYDVRLKSGADGIDSYLDRLVGRIERAFGVASGVALRVKEIVGSDAPAATPLDTPLDTPMEEER